MKNQHQSGKRRDKNTEYTTEFSFEMEADREHQSVTDSINESYVQYGISQNRKGERDANQ